MKKSNIFVLVSLVIFQFPHVLFAANATKRAQNKAKRIEAAKIRQLLKNQRLYAEHKQREWKEQEEAFKDFESIMEGTYTLKLVTKWLYARFYGKNN